MEYKNSTGNCNVPQKYVTDNGVNLGGWLNRQFQSMKKDALNDNRRVRLENLGVVSSLNNDHRWEFNFNWITDIVMFILVMKWVQ